MTLKGYTIFIEKLTGSLKNLHFDEFVLSKAYKLLDEKFRRVMSHETEE